MDCSTAVTTEGKCLTDHPTGSFEGAVGQSAKTPTPPPKRRVKTIKDKKVRVTEITYSVGDVFASCVDLCCELANVSKGSLPIAAAPFLEESG